MGIQKQRVKDIARSTYMHENNVAVSKYNAAYERGMLAGALAEKVLATKSNLFGIDNCYTPALNELYDCIKKPVRRPKTEPGIYIKIGASHDHVAFVIPGEPDLVFDRSAMRKVGNKQYQGVLRRGIVEAFTEAYDLRQAKKAKHRNKRNRKAS